MTEPAFDKEQPPEWVPPHLVRTWADGTPDIRKMIWEVHQELKVIDFGLLTAGDEVDCAICGQRFEDGQRVFHVGDGSWNGEGPNWVESGDWAFVHAHCVEAGVR